MENTMYIMYTTGKDRMLDTLEIFYICRETKRNDEINDKLTGNPNVVFDVLVHKNPTECTPPHNN